MEAKLKQRVYVKQIRNVANVGSLSKYIPDIEEQVSKVIPKDHSYVDTAVFTMSKELHKIGVVCVFDIDGEEVVSWSICNPGDKFNVKEGVEIARERAIRMKELSMDEYEKLPYDLIPNWAKKEVEYAMEWVKKYPDRTVGGEA